MNSVHGTKFLTLLARYQNHLMG